MDFRDRHVVISGGAGALGSAVVAALVDAGAVCHVPCRDEAEAQRFRLREHKRVTLTVTGSLADETPIARLYEGIAPLWASIHLAGGFAAAPLRETGVATLRQQIDMNFVSCALCCRAAVNAMTRHNAGAGGRIVNVAARAALEWRSGAGMVAYTASKAAVAALTVALAEEVAKEPATDGILGSMRWRPRSSTRPPIGGPCPRPISRSGRKSRRSRRRFFFSPRPTIASPAARWSRFMEDRRAHKRAGYSACSPPPCGEGLGVGVGRLLRDRRRSRVASRPPSLPSPTRGEGAF
ncbi:MAG: SDR family NAD(P)-dependent oxidoreductase [Xanthobacteraceae bacterium]